MRGKSSSSKSKNGGGLETEKLKEPHLSGAYIRSLVKQLTSSRTKDSSNSNESLEGEGIPTNQNLACDDHKQGKSQQPPQHKKQVRRRLHTSRPYQERLLNMAEARREIVTALKFHRASMKQASEKQQQLESGYNVQPLESSSHQLSLEQEEAKLKSSRRNPRIYASNSSNIPSFSSNNNFENYYSSSYSSSTTSPGFCSSPYSWPVVPPPIGPPPPFYQENFNFPLPSQTLGLNLNLQDFNNLDTSSFHFGNNPSSIYSSSSPSTTSSSALTEEIPSMAWQQSAVAVEAVEFEDSGLHQAMDDKEMAEIRSIGEQHQVEWNDTMNLMSSACWFKFLKAMEIEAEDQKVEDYNSVSSPFDEVMEFPVWLNGNESFLHHVNDFCSDDYLQDPALPCMDIEEIEGMDGDWLA